MPWQKIAVGAAIVVTAVFVVYFIRTDEYDPAGFVPAAPSASVIPAVAGSPPPGSAATSVMTPTPAATQAADTGLSLLNSRRSAAGVGDLATSEVLQAEAQRHAADMAGRGYFDHTTPDGTTFAQRMAATSYPGGAVAENIGLASSRLVADVVEQWMQSPEHRANLLDPAARVVGIGTASGTYEGLPVLYVVAIFGAQQ